MPAERLKTSHYGTKSASRPGRAVVELADRQHGVVSLWQLIALGVSDRMARGWVASGRLQRIHHGVFAVGHRALRREGHYMAAVLACGEGAVLSHGSAADLHGLRSTDGARIDVSVASRNGRSRRGLRIQSGSHLGADEIAEVDGIPCTSVARTMLDLASILDRRGIERACERAERIEVFDLFAVGALLARHRGRRGVARLRAILAEWNVDLSRTRSELEVLFLRLIIRAGIEGPVVNGPVQAGASTFEVDFHWPRHRLVVETDGKAFHDQPLARRRDAERDRALASAGWRVRRFAYDDVARQPERTLQALRGLLADSRLADNVPLRDEIGQSARCGR